MVFLDAEKPFWREQPLSDEEVRLLSLLFKAHDASVFRPNLSSETVVGVCIGAGEYLKAIPAAMLTLGGLHGPIIQTVSLLEAQDPALIANLILQKGQKVPGWGSSFAKGQKDPIWLEFEEALRLNAPDLFLKIEHVTKQCQHFGKIIHPNPACYTAAAAIVLDIPASVAPWLFLQGRLAGWTRLALKSL